ncbi:Npun_R2821/Npun_R2822 family protein [Phormidesmis sp. 146-33]
MNGICTLANDYVYEQLVALLNSIEAIMGSDFPVCVYPYDNNTSRIEMEIAKRPNVQLYQDQESIDRWDRYVKQIWDSHPTAQQQWQKHSLERYHRIGTHRRFCAFDGPFDQFLYMDADTLLMGDITPIFEQLNHHDWVVYDFQYRDIDHVYEAASRQLQKVFSAERLNAEIFCSGLYAAKKNTFSAEKLDWLLKSLQSGEAEVLYCMAPDQTILNYMVMRSQLSIYNFALQLPTDQKTGCCVTSPHFSEQDHILYDHGKRLVYIHYIGLSSSLFRNLCSGENVDFPYRDLFLHYRYLNEPENRPVFNTSPIPYHPPSPPSLVSRVLEKIKLVAQGVQS